MTLGWSLREKGNLVIEIIATMVHVKNTMREVSLTPVSVVVSESHAASRRRGYRALGLGPETSR